jgi:hypothetical protein
MPLGASFFRFYGSGILVDRDYNNLGWEFEEEKSFQVQLQQRSSEMVVLIYYSPMEIQHALQQTHKATVDILAVVAAMDASDHTPYHPDEIQEVTLMDDRYVSNMVFDGHEFAYH